MGLRIITIWGRKLSPSELLTQSGNVIRLIIPDNYPVNTPMYFNVERVRKEGFQVIKAINPEFLSGERCV